MPSSFSCCPVNPWMFVNEKPDRKNKTDDPKEELKYIIHLDANNLDGYSMSKFLLTGGFKRVDRKEFELNKYTSNSSRRCVLEVDLEYL